MTFPLWLKKNQWLLLILAIGIVVVLWQLLLPGYILTLDMVFTPQIPAPVDVSGAFRNGWILRWMLHSLSLIIPGWIVQKIVFVGLFLSLGGLAYRYLLPKSSPSTRVLAGLLYLFNPFVYTRFLAGQWGILLSYALLPLVFYWSDFTDLKDQSTWKRALGLGFALTLAFFGSLHLGIIALFVMGSQIVATMPLRSRRAWLELVGAGCVTIIATAYWTLPALFRRGESVVASFDARHLSAFKTVSDKHLGALGNVLTLNGFWGEGQVWAQQWMWPKDRLWLWGIAGVIIACFIVLGIIRTIREKESRRQAISLLALGILSAIFAVGEGDSFLRPINTWLFTHIGFWNGFRDSQKWVAILALVYVWFFASGLELRGRVMRIFAMLAVILYTFPMLFGFWGQLKPVWYPAAWTEANQILKEDPNCKAIFLPWHSYYTSKFANGRLIANGSAAFFSCEIITSRRVELGSIYTQGPADPAYDAIDGAITGHDQLSSQQVQDVLHAAGIRYVIVADDLEGEDSFAYAFLKDFPTPTLAKKGLTVYTLVP